MTAKQRSYIEDLAHRAGLHGAETAIQQATGMSRSKQARKGVSGAQASATIEMLLARI